MNLAKAAGCAPRYVREWLAAQAASGYVHYEDGRFSLTPEQAFVFAEPDSPVNLIGAFDTAAAMVENQPKVQAAFKTGRGRRLGRTGRLHVLRRGAAVPAGLRQCPRAGVAAGARWRHRQAEGGRDGGRRGVWTRAVDYPDGAGVPQFQVYRLRLPPGIDCRRDRARPGAWHCEPQLRGRACAGLRGARLRSDHLFRLPARHGRSEDRRGAYPQGAERRRHLDGGRADGRATRWRTISTRSGGSTTRPRR